MKQSNVEEEQVTGTVTAIDRLQLLDKLVAGEVVAGCQAYENLEFFCDEGGGRFAGSPGELKVRDYLLSKLKEYGLENVHAQEYRYKGWVRGPAWVSMVLPGEKEFPCFSLPHSPAGEVELEVVFLGPGGPEEFLRAGDSLRGKIALVTNETPQGLGRGVHRSEKYGRAVRAGAAAFLYMRASGMLPETGTIRHNATGLIPALSISRESGTYILRRMQQGKVVLKLATCSKSPTLAGWNIIGEIPGCQEPDKVIVAGAHIDGHDISQAASDNGGGSAVILEAARALAKHRELLPKTIRFIWFTTEEIGMTGSNYYAGTCEDLDSVEFMFNVDVAGGGGVPGITTMGFQETKKMFLEFAQVLNQPMRVGTGVLAYSDMYAFHLCGIPSVYFGSSAPDGSWNFGHTSADTFDKMEPRGLMLDSLAVSRLLAHISFRKAVARKSPSEVSGSIDHLREAFELEGRNPDGSTRLF